MAISWEGSRKSGKNGFITIILAIMVGIFGAHKFYLGEKRMGLVMLGSSSIGLLLFLLAGFSPLPGGFGVIGIILLLGTLLQSWVHALTYIKAIISRDWEEYLDKEAQWDRMISEYKEKREKKKKKRKKKKRKRKRWRDKNKYILIDKYKNQKGTLKVEEWSDGNSEIDGSINIDGTSKGKSRGLILGPFTGSKSKSSISAKGDIDASISDNIFTAEIQTLTIKDEWLVLDSDAVEFKMELSEIDRAYKTNTGFIVESKGTTFRIKDLPKEAPVEDVVKYIERNRSEHSKDSRSKPEPSENSDKELTDKLEELQELHDKGVLSDEEFESKKEELLNNF